jgi:hypothetical protein
MNFWRQGLLEASTVGASPDPLLELIAMMNADFTSWFDRMTAANQGMFETMIKASEITTQAQAKLFNQQIEAARGMIEFGNDQMKSVAERRDPREMFAGGADTSVEFMHKVTANAQDAWKVQTELRDELVQLFEDQMKQFGNVSADESAGDVS